MGDVATLYSRMVGAQKKSELDLQRQKILAEITKNGVATTTQYNAILGDLQTAVNNLNLSSITDSEQVKQALASIPEDIRPFSAVAYFFARKIYEKYQVLAIFTQRWKLSGFHL